MSSNREHWTSVDWQTYYERKIAKLRESQEIQERLHDGDRKMLRRVSRDYKQSLEKIRQQNDDLVRAREEAEAANEAKSHFLAMITHEIRTPLSSILGMLELLDETEANDRQQELLDICRLNSDILLGLINNVLDCSRLEAGLEQATKCPTPLMMTIEDVAAAFEPKATEKGLALTCDLSPDLPAHIMMDTGKLKQILVNLINNSIKYTREGSIGITARCDSSKEWLDIAVTDTGIGIHEADRDIIFQPFGQASNNTQLTTVSSGLGLHITRNLVELLGGKLSFESTVGKGSTFMLALPMTECTLAEKTTGHDGVHDDPRMDGLSVLMVDDDESIRMLVGFFLEGQPMNLDFACDGMSACHRVLQKPYDLVLMDMHMPVLSGHETVRQIRNHPDPAIAGTTIVALTAGNTADVTRDCMDAGCDAVLTKPITKKALLEAIAKHGRS